MPQRRAGQPRLAHLATAVPAGRVVPQAQDVRVGEQPREAVDHALGTADRFDPFGDDQPAHAVVLPGSSAARAVRSMMTKSPARVQLSTYDRSSRTDSSHDSDERPLTCQRPVMPGFTMNRLCTWSA